jgi:hypothetical protein
VSRKDKKMEKAVASYEFKRLRIEVNPVRNSSGALFLTG